MIAKSVKIRYLKRELNNSDKIDFLRLIKREYTQNLSGKERDQSSFRIEQICEKKKVKLCGNICSFGKEQNREEEWLKDPAKGNATESSSASSCVLIASN